MPYPTQGSAPWDATLESEIDAQDALLQAEIDAIPGGGDMLGSNNLSELTNLPDAQANLGLGGAATLDVGQDVGTVAAGDDPRIVGALQTSADLLGVNPDNARVNIDVYSTEEVDALIVEAVPNLGDPITLIHGGTGATDAAGARLALDVYSTEETDAAIAASSGSGGAVASVDGQTGVVDLSGTYQPLTSRLTALGGTTDTGTGAIVRSSSPALTTPTGIVKSDVGLGNVDNTSDANKPVSTATTTALALKANLASPTFTGTVTIPTGASITAPTGLVKGDVGLGNVDNTADTAKPVSTAQQTALNLKANLASPTFTGTVTIPTGASITSPTIAGHAVIEGVTATGATGTGKFVFDGTPTLATPTLTSPVLNTGVSGTAVDTDSTFAANSDTKLASQKAVATALALKAPLASPSFTGLPDFADGFSVVGRKIDMKARNLYAMRHARAALALGSCTVLYGPGDSILEGSSLTAVSDRWANRVTDILSNAVTAQSPGVGYIPFATVNSTGISGASTPTSPVSNFFTQTGATATLGSDGLGKRSWKSGTGSTSTKTATNVACDRFRIYYNKGSALGTFTVTVDGGAPATVDCHQAGAGPTIAAWDSSTDGGLSLTPGLHTIAVTTVNTGTVATYGVNIAGVMFYLANSSAGIRQFEAGHPTLPSWVPASQELAQIALIQPDLVFIEYGANDEAFNIAFPGVFDPADTALNFKNTVTAINGVCTVAPSVVFLATWGNGSASTDASWRSYRDAIMNAAIEVGAAYVDVYEALGWQGTTTTLQDGVAHPTAAGSKAYARVIAEALDLPTGMNWDGALHSSVLAGGGNWSISDIGLNSVGLAVQTANSDQFASLYVGTFAAAPVLGFGSRTALFDTILGRNTAGVFSVQNALKLSGLTGATAGSRYVGATASVAPTTGTFFAGDWCTTRTGRMWCCTVGDGTTLGTWVEVGSPTYAPLASPTFTGTATLNSQAQLSMWPDTVTFTADQVPPLAFGGTHTINYSSGQKNPSILINPTVKFAQGGGAFLSHTGVSLAPTVTTTTGAANGTSLGLMYGIAVGTTVTADTATGVVGSLIDFNSSPVTSVANSGTMTLSGITSFKNSPTIGTGTTVTTLTGLSITNAGGSGTVTTQIGIDIAALSKGGTNIGIRNKASTQLGSSAQLTVDASGNLSTSGTVATGALTVTGAATASGNIGFNGKSAQALTGIAAPTATALRTAAPNATYSTTGATGATAGAFDTAAHRDNVISDLANTMQRLGALITDLRANGVVG